MTSTIPGRSGDAFLRAAGYLLLGPGGSRRRNDGPRLSWSDQPSGGRSGTGSHRYGHHLVHGQSVRCPPQSRRHIAFALRKDFPWQRVPGYILVQLIGATLAALFLHAVINVSAMYGSNYPAHGYSDMAAFWMELILTMGLVSVFWARRRGRKTSASSVPSASVVTSPWPVCGAAPSRDIDEPCSHVWA